MVPCRGGSSSPITVGIARDWIPRHGGQSHYGEASHAAPARRQAVNCNHESRQGVRDMPRHHCPSLTTATTAAALRWCLQLLAPSPLSPSLFSVAISLMLAATGRTATWQPVDVRDTCGGTEPPDPRFHLLVAAIVVGGGGAVSHGCKQIAQE
jgi:hypothetical protein